MSTGEIRKRTLKAGHEGTATHETCFDYKSLLVWPVHHPVFFSSGDDAGNPIIPPLLSPQLPPKKLFRFENMTPSFMCGTFDEAGKTRPPPPFLLL